jgi:hypothetical protein
MTINEVRQVAQTACREFDVRRLDAFGSLARNCAKSDSDVDLLVEFNDPDRNASARFFGLLHRFEDALHCNVDLLTVGSLRNPYFKKRVLQEKVPVYEG